MAPTNNMAPISSFAGKAPAQGQTDTRPPLSSFAGKASPTSSLLLSQNNNQAPSVAPSIWQSMLNGVGKVTSAIEQPFVSLAATPVQLAAKAAGVPDPYANGVPGIGDTKVSVSPVDKPLQKIGEAGEVASYLIPYGRFAKLGTLGKIGAGATTGYGADVASNLAQGKEGQDATSPGLGTLLGTAIPAIGPTLKVLGRALGETLGVTTGTGYGSVRQAFEAGTKGLGSPEEKAFIDALKGNATPESLVNEARSSLGDIIANRRTAYQDQLAKIAGDKTSLNIQPIVDTLNEQLGKFKIGVAGNGSLDFSRSAIRFDPAAQSDVQTIFNEMKGFGTQSGDRTAVGVDSLKQALSDLYSKSSNVRALVSAVRGTTRDVLSGVPGYDQLTKDYADKTDIIHDIQRGLSLGDQGQIDTAYKKLISALRLNNEFRKEMIGQLDQATGGTLSSKIAGEQMSEILPRGLMRPLEGGAAGAAALTGQFVPLLKFAALASPKVVGSLVNALGLTAPVAQKLFESIGGQTTAMRAVSPVVQASAENQNQ